MTPYAAPTRDMLFCLEELADLAQIATLPGAEEATPDLVAAVLEEAGRFAAEVIAPLNTIGDAQGSRLENGAVRTPDGWRDAYARFVETGWNALAFDPDHGGQGLPWVVGTAVQEMWHAASLAFGLCPMLTQGAVDALAHHGSPAQKETWLPRLISGEWTGTMNLTEPQAGSDVGAVRTRAVPDGRGWRIKGQKIFITYGDHDLAGNILHLVLARTPDAPAGTRGLSLFLVPKFLPDADGNFTVPNDLHCVSLEHKMGIHASPTAVMAFGDNEGAWGELIGEEHKGMRCMFTMMNNARLSVGLEGVAIAERAYQQARAYAHERVQGKAVGAPSNGGIVHHPDVRRMLLTMKALTEAGRALAYRAAGLIDIARAHPDRARRAEAQAEVDFLIPIVKGWCTEMGSEVASMGVQVHGGIGYIEETGAAQHMRDARITEIYEGTTGIQANDLVGRKLMLDHGATARRLIEAMRQDAARLGGDLADLGRALERAVHDLAAASEWMLARQTGEAADPRDSLAGAVPYMRLWGTVAGGWLMAKAALAAQRGLAQAEGEADGFLVAKIATARLHAAHVLPRSAGLAAAATAGAGVVMDLDPAYL